MVFKRVTDRNHSLLRFVYVRGKLDAFTVCPNCCSVNRNTPDMMLRNSTEYLRTTERAVERMNKVNILVSVNRYLPDFAHILWSFGIGIATVFDCRKKCKVMIKIDISTYSNGDYQIQGINVRNPCKSVSLNQITRNLFHKFPMATFFARSIQHSMQLRIKGTRRC